MERSRQSGCHLRGVVSTVQEVVDVRRLVGSGKEVEHPPEVDGAIFRLAEVPIVVVRIGDEAYLRIREEQFREKLPFCSGQVLIQPALPEELCELRFGHPEALESLHELEVTLHVVAAEQLDSGGEQRCGLHHPDGSLVSVRRYAEVTAHHVLEADEQLELLRRFAGEQVLLVVGANTTDCEIQPASVDVLEDRRHIEAEHHALVIDGLVALQELRDRLVDGFGNASFHHVRDADGRAGDLLIGENLLGGIEDRPDEALVGDGHLVVLGEHRDDALLLEMVHLDLLGVGLDERKFGGSLVLLLGGLEDGQHSHLVSCLLGRNAHRPLLCDCRKECRFHNVMGLLGLLLTSEILAAGLSPALLPLLLNRSLLGLRVLWLWHRSLGILDRSLLLSILLRLLAIRKVFTCIDVET